MDLITVKKSNHEDKVQMVITCFANHVSSQLRNLDPWRTLIEGMDVKLRLNGTATSLRPSKYVWAYDWHFLDS